MAKNTGFGATKMGAQVEVDRLPTFEARMAAIKSRKLRASDITGEDSAADVRDCENCGHAIHVGETAWGDIDGHLFCCRRCATVANDLSL